MKINFKKMEVLFEEEFAIKDHFQIIAPPAGEKSWFSFKDKKKNQIIFEAKCCISVHWKVVGNKSKAVKFGLEHVNKDLGFSICFKRHFRNDGSQRRQMWGLVRLCKAEVSGSYDDRKTNCDWRQDHNGKRRPHLENMHTQTDVPKAKPIPCSNNRLSKLNTSPPLSSLPLPFPCPQPTSTSPSSAPPPPHLFLGILSVFTVPSCNLSIIVLSSHTPPPICDNNASTITHLWNETAYTHTSECKVKKPPGWYDNVE